MWVKYMKTNSGYNIRQSIKKITSFHDTNAEMMRVDGVKSRAISYEESLKLPRVVE